MKISAQAGNQVLEVTVERENGVYTVEIDGVNHRVDALKLEGDFYSILTDGKSYEVSVEATRNGYHVRHGATERIVTLTDPGRRAREAQAGGQGPAEVVSQMPGKVVRVLVDEGDTVTEGQGLVVVEAMKMENEIAAPKDGRVSTVAVKPGQTIDGGGLLVVVE